ncbi:MAG: TrbG/VirB9 family P-type conjugative transfer protein [Bacteroidota bacterium]
MTALRLALGLTLALSLAEAAAQTYTPARVTLEAVDRLDDALPPTSDGGFTDGAVLVTGSQMEDALEGLLLEYRRTGRARTLRQSTVMVFPFGHVQPVLATAPLRASVIELERGEVVLGMAAGDTERWAYELSYTGAGGDTPIVLVKPLDADITTNLVLSTDRRIYHVTLDAPPADDVLVTAGRPRRGNARGDNPQGRYTRHVRFYYPDEALARLADGLDVAAALAPARTPGALASLSDLHFEYRVDGDPEVERAVERVFDDGVHTYVELTERARRSGSAPVLFVLGPGDRREVLNYALSEGRYITDRTFEQAELVLGASVRTGLFGLGGRRQVERSARITRLD